MQYIETTPPDAEQYGPDQANNELAGPTQGPMQEPAHDSAIGSTDGELLMRFTRHSDQAAFAELVEAHGALVWSVCRQVLRREADVEDAFQATFLVLARRASDIRTSDSAAGWLYRVAHRVSLSLYRKNKRRCEEPLNGHDFVDSGEGMLEQLHRRHSVKVLVEELRMLPARYQQPLILCYLQGHTRAAVAEMLDLTAATIKGRVARGKRMLRHRLARRGVALSTAFGVAAAATNSAQAAAASQSLVPATTSAATEFLTNGSAAAQLSSPATVSLAQQGVSTMFYAALAKSAVSLLAVLTLGVGAALVANEPPTPPAAAGGPAISLLASSDSLAGERVSEVEITAPQSETAGENSLAEARPPSRQRSSSESAASVAGSVRDSVQVEFATTDNDEDILVLRGSQPAVNRTQQRMMQMFDRPQTQFRADNLVPQSANSPADTPSIRELELQHLYWETRMKGLRLKADGIEQQIERLQELKKTGDVSPRELVEATERVGDMMLLKADAFEAEAKMLEVQRRIEKQRGPQPDFPSQPLQPTAPSAPQTGFYGPTPPPQQVQPPAIATPQPLAEPSPFVDDYFYRYDPESAGFAPRGGN